MQGDNCDKDSLLIVYLFVARYFGIIKTSALSSFYIQYTKSYVKTIQTPSKQYSPDILSSICKGTSTYLPYHVLCFGNGCLFQYSKQVYMSTVDAGELNTNSEGVVGEQLSR